MAVNETLANDSPDPVVNIDPRLQETVDVRNGDVRNGDAGHADGRPRPIGRLSGDLGRYKILDRLGEGGMGTVYLAHDSQFDTKVALKVPQFTSANDQQVIQRFLREARSAIKLRHSNICPVYDVGEINGQHYLAMAYIEGQPLSALIDARHPLPERQIARIVCKIALALQEAHQNGIVHRDLKPGNVMFDEKRNEPVVMDFGLASQIDGPADSRLTQSGTMLGSPGYMSPEQVSNHRELIGPASDIYSLGVILYEMLACRLPFEGSSAVVFGMIALQEPEPPSRYRPGLDPRLEAICLKAMAKKIDDRYATMHAFAKVLKAYDGAQPPSPDFSDTITAATIEATQFLSRSESPALSSNQSPAQGQITERLERKPQPAHQAPARTDPARTDIAVWIGSSIVVTLAVVALVFTMLNRPTPSISQGTAPVHGTPQLAPGEPNGVKPGTAAKDQSDETVNRRPAVAQDDFGPFPRRGGARRGPPVFPLNGPPEFHNFKLWDRNSDGQLDPDEYPRHIIRRADTNGDDSLTRAEFDAAYDKQGPALFRPPIGEDDDDPGRPPPPPGRGPPPRRDD